MIQKIEEIGKSVDFEPEPSNQTAKNDCEILQLTQKLKLNQFMQIKKFKL